MKNLIKLIGFAVLMAIIAFPMNAQTFNNYWIRNVNDTATVTLDFSVANDGVVAVTVGGIAETHNESGWNRWKASVSHWYISHILEANARYTYIFEAWTESGTRDLTVQYYQNHDTQTYLSSDISITNRRSTYTITGLPLPSISGGILSFQCGDQLGTFYIKVLEIREATPEEITRSHWQKFVAHDSTATLDFSVARDGVVTVNIGGRAETNRWHRWKANVRYEYTANANTRYTYVFEAWTQRGNRDLDINYYYDHVDNIYLMDTVSITNRRTTYTVTGLPIPKSGNFDLEFRGADQLGTFYVKILEIREATPEEIARAEIRARWGKHIADDSTATLDFSVADDGVVTVNVGGRAMPQANWKALVGYQYSMKENTSYTYVFEAWTQRGNRELDIMYYYDGDDQIWLSERIIITNRRTTYTVTGQAIPKDGNLQLQFHCANQLGTFYIRVIEIREN